MNEDKLKQIVKEYNLEGGNWKISEGIEAGMIAKNIIDKIPEGTKYPIENGYIIKENGRLNVYCIVSRGSGNIDIGILDKLDKLASVPYDKEDI